MKNYKTFKAPILILVIIVLILGLAYSGFQKLKSTVFYNQDEGTVTESSVKTVVVDGVKYFPRQDITVLMVLGIDKYGEMKSSNYHRNDGSADVVALLVFDEKDMEYNALYLNRDSMLDMNVLDINGDYAGTTYGQLALAYSYGSGLKDSCENVKETLSDFLKGVYIDHYVAVNMEAISIMNDAVGGVSVYVTDDFSEVDPTIQQGEMLLLGEQSVNFVRPRKDVGDQLNLTRMERHKEYVRNFADAFNSCVEADDGFAADVMEQILPYMVTDSSLNTLNAMFNRYEGYTFGDIISPDGVNEITNGHYGFYVDEESLDEIILRLFYTPIS